MLREDREALRNMQKHQPRFTEDQKRELSQVHPWVRTGRLPRAINISVKTSPTLNWNPRLSNEHRSGFQGCKGCKSPPVVPPADPFDVEIHEMELCSVLNAQEDGGKGKKSLSEILMDDTHPEEEDEEEETEERTAKTQDDSQDMPAEEASLDAEAEKLDMNP